MGVTRARRNPCSVDGEDQDDGLISAFVDEPATPPNSAPLEARTSSSKKVRKFRPRYWYLDSPRAQKTKYGMRQMRRTDNLNQLITMTEELGIEDEEELKSFCEPSSSPFSELFIEQEKMKIWNDFINRTEEQQIKLLNGMSWDSDNDDDVDDIDENWEKVEKQNISESWADLGDDKRAVHPGFSAEQCFKRIDSQLRSLLNKRHVPIGMLANLEDEVTGFFKVWPSSIFISQLPSSYDRLLMHALCQFLDLTSKSFDDDHGVRQTQVENKNLTFSPPIQSLSEYLESKH